jgi:hypothetical protein
MTAAPAQKILQVAQCDIRLSRHRFGGLETDVRYQNSVRRLQNRMVRRQGGSKSNTSRPAPARRFRPNASTSADWSTTGPRAVFIRMAELFILANCSRPIPVRLYHSPSLPNFLLPIIDRMYFLIRAYPCPFTVLFRSSVIAAPLRSLRPLTDLKANR